jgi:hypothetical protein
VKLALTQSENVAVRLAMQEAERLRARAEGVVVEALEAVAADRGVQFPATVRYSKGALEWDEKPATPPAGA